MWKQELIFDWLGFNGTFSTNRPYRAFDKYVAVKTVKLISSRHCYMLGIHTIKHYNKPFFNLVFVGEPVNMKDITCESSSLPSQSLG